MFVDASTEAAQQDAQSPCEDMTPLPPPHVNAAVHMTSISNSMCWGYVVVLIRPTLVVPRSDTPKSFYCTIIRDFAARGHIGPGIYLDAKWGETDGKHEWNSSFVKNYRMLFHETA